jgi:copper chaperone CopZ
VQHGCAVGFFASFIFVQFQFKIKMKKIFFTAVCAVLLQCIGFAQNKKTETVSFWVAGVCGRCETVIESTLDTRGVVSADYDLEKEMLTITYKPDKITLEQIHAMLNEVGYDTAASKCTDEQYARVHHCCKYREMQKH